MGKRSNFKRVERDFYPTPREAVKPLLDHLPLDFTYAEPCVGQGDLIGHFQHFYDFDPLRGRFEAECMYADDIDWGKDALLITKEDVRNCRFIITNPPWSRDVLHPMIEHFRNLKPTWLLFDADWMHTKQSSEYMKYCHKIVSVGRVKWIPGSKHTGKDNCCWYLFDKITPEEGETVFYGR